MTNGAFDDLADAYDALIDWPKRLANEEPFYRALFQRVGVRRILDAACGTGRHAAMFHAWGQQVEGADLSPGMIARCRRQFGESDSLGWVVRAFDEPIAVAALFDAVLCVGNSLALAPNHDAVAGALRQMLRATRAGGVCVIQVLNLWHLPDGPCVWQKHKQVTLGGAGHLLIKGVHRAGDCGYVELIDVALTPAGPVPRFDSAKFLGLDAAVLTRIAHDSGTREVRCYGSFQSAPYDRASSPDLIMVLEK